jgi:hypothetical protein
MIILSFFATTGNEQTISLPFYVILFTQKRQHFNTLTTLGICIHPPTRLTVVPEKQKQQQPNKSAFSNTSFFSPSLSAIYPHGR